MKINLKVFIINTIHTIFIFSFISAHMAIFLYPKNAFFIPLIVGIICTLLILLLPNFKTFLLPHFIEKPIFKIIVIAYLAFSTCYFLLICFTILSEIFYLRTPIYLLAILLVFFVGINLRCSMKTLLNITLIIFILIIFSNFFIFFNMDERDFGLILPLDFRFPSLHQLFLFIGYFLDGFLFYFVPYPKKESINKSTLLLSVITACIISAFFIFDNYTFLTYEFFENINFPALYRYKIYSGPKYIEHFDSILSFKLSFFMITKATFNLQLLRIFLKQKNTFSYQFFVSFILGLIIVILFYAFPSLIHYLQIPSIILTTLSLLLYFSLLRCRKYE